MSAFTFPAPNLDLWMPFNVGRFLRKSSQLTPQQTEVQLWGEFRKWAEKRIKAHAKASWASRVRWAKERGIDPSILEHLSIAPNTILDSLSKSEKTRNWLANAKKRSEKASKAAKVRWAKKGSAASMSAAAENPGGLRPPTPPGLLTKNLLSINPLTPFSPDLLPQSSPNILQSILQIFGLSEGMGKPGNFAAAGLAGQAGRETIVGGVAASVARHGGGKATEFSLWSDPQKPGSGGDIQFEFFRAEVLAFWRGQNPGKADCPWIRSDRRALHQFIVGSPTLTLDEFRQLLRNRAQSEINPSELPRRWLRDLMEYADGPLDRFKKPLQKPRQL
jgi:hypothetical protein